MNHFLITSLHINLSISTIPISSYNVIKQQQKVLNLITLHFSQFISISIFSYFVSSQQQKNLKSVHYTSIHLFLTISIFHVFISQQQITNILFFHQSTVNLCIISVKPNQLFKYFANQKIVTLIFYDQIQLTHCSHYCLTGQYMSHHSSPAMPMRRTSLFESRSCRSFRI